MVNDKKIILEYCLKNAAFDGWSSKLLHNAALSMDKPAAYAEVVFPGGITEVIEFWSRETDAEMVAGYKPAGGEKTPQIIYDLIATRLEQQRGHKQAVRLALAHLGATFSAGPGTKLIYNTVDTIWRAAGDNSTDFNFYTKRATLAAVYGATLALWLNDESEMDAETLAFLKNRLKDVGSFGKWKAKMKNLLQFKAA